MYKREVPHLPKTVSREQFVSEIFDLGLRFEYECDTLVTAVEIGDRFVSYKGDRVPYKDYKRANRNYLTPQQINIIEELVPQVYSRELAHISLVISANFHEDVAYSAYQVADELGNGYVFKMEWEICIMNNFSIRNGDFINLLTLLTLKEKYDIRGELWNLTRSICMDQTLLYANPITVITSIIVLTEIGKLRAYTEYRERIFMNLMLTIAEEYDIPVSDLLQAYIKHKSTPL